MSLATDFNITPGNLCFSGPSNPGLSRTMPIIIGITGKAGAGKDTVADHLVGKYGYSKYSLSSPLKRALNTMFGWSMEDWASREWKEAPQKTYGGKSPRVMAQLLGTEWGRDRVSPDVWLQPLIEMAKVTSYIVVPDVRFNNEATAILALGGVIWEVVSYSATNVAPHSSETGVNEVWVDEIISNGSTKDALYKTVDKLLIPPYGHDA